MQVIESEMITRRSDIFIIFDLRIVNDVQPVNTLLIRSGRVSMIVNLYALTVMETN